VACGARTVHHVKRRAPDVREASNAPHPGSATAGGTR
jgi:hypothetical protein